MAKTDKLNSASIQSWLEGRTGWKRKSNTLIKEFHFSSFRDSVVFVNRVATLADTADHHPDIDVRYDRVTLTLSTHSAGGITEKDLTLAEQVDFATSAG
jgi:4a-hydroxytetrahydrobiopterin dehydratase